MRDRTELDRDEPGNHRAALLHAAVRISALSCAVSAAIAVAAIILGIQADSLALVAFGLESVVDGAASAVLFWRFGVEASHPHRGAGLERRVSRLIGGVLAVVATYLTIAAVRSLIAGPEAHVSSASIALAGASLAVLPWIAYRKLSLARRLRSRSLRADGALTLGGAVLAAMTLAAILMARFLGFEAADPVAALIVAIALLSEAVRALRGAEDVLTDPEDLVG
jgi:divalent metal cation (Fe/Co/Zn/Cd) transporter